MTGVFLGEVGGEELGGRLDRDTRDGRGERSYPRGCFGDVVCCDEDFAGVGIEGFSECGVEVGEEVLFFGGQVEAVDGLG